MKKQILFLCDASDIDVVEQSFAENADYELTIETSERIFQFGVPQYLAQTIERILNNPEMYDGIVGTHDSSAVFAAVIAEATGHRFAPVSAIINCQNKYLCRRIQKAVIQEYTPNYAIALDYLRDPSRLSTPFFIKPARANISFGSHKIEHPEQLDYFIAMESMDIARFNQHYTDALFISESGYNALNVATCNSFLCEDLINGTQVTLDGYVFEGEVFFFGVTKAVYHPGTNSFHYHKFPHRFSERLQERIEAALKRLIPALGIDNSFFNAELRADEAADTFKIIEINGRIAFQFAKTIESVTGVDPLHMLCNVATGIKPTPPQIHDRIFKHCYNFELHHFNDAVILETPTQSAFAEIRMKYPEIHIRNLIHENASLSDFRHNPESYRYCVIDIPGNEHEEIMAKYDDVVSMLGYKFSASINAIGNPDVTQKTPPDRTVAEKHEV